MSDDVDDPHDVDIYASHRSASQRYVHLESPQGIARINLDRLLADVDRSAGVGVGREGGLSRLALSDVEGTGPPRAQSRGDNRSKQIQ